jgi:hypothetical protein
MTGSLADALPTMHTLRCHLLKHRDDALDRTEMVKKIETAIAKLDKYWNIMIKTPAYLMSVVCDPRRNLDWIKWVHDERHESPEEALTLIQRFFTDRHDKDKSRDLCAPYSEDGVVTFGSWPSLKVDSRRQHNAGWSSSTVADREFRGYSSLQPVIFNSGHPMEYWRKCKDLYPTWSKIAFEMLSIPAMSAEVERVFSRCMRPIKWS